MIPLARVDAFGRRWDLRSGVDERHRLLWRFEEVDGCFTVGPLVYSRSSAGRGLAWFIRELSQARLADDLSHEHGPF